MDKITEIQNRIKAVFDGLDQLNIKGKDQMMIVLQMAQYLEQCAQMLDEINKAKEDG